MSVTLKGAKELADLLQSMPDTAATKAQRTGLGKGAARLRTYIRRAAPRKKGILKSAIRSAMARKKFAAYVKLGKVRGEKQIRFYYKTLEHGRKAYTRRKTGKSYAASPQMATNFFEWTFVRHQTEIAQLIVNETRIALYKNAGQLAARLNAPLKVRRGR